MSGPFPLVPLSSGGRRGIPGPFGAQTRSRNNSDPGAKFSSSSEARNHQNLKWAGDGPRETGTPCDSVSSVEETGTHDSV